MGHSGQLGNVSFQSASGPLGASGGGPTPTFNSVTVNGLPSYQIVYPDQNNILASDPGFTRSPLLTHTAGSLPSVLIKANVQTSGSAAVSVLDLDSSVTSAGGGAQLIQRWMWNAGVVASMDRFGQFNTSSVTATTYYVTGTFNIQALSTTTALTINMSGSQTMLFVDATAGNVTVNLPSPGTLGNLRIIKKIDPTANTVTIVPNGAATIDGAANKVISTQYTALILASQAGGGNWFIISAN